MCHRCCEIIILGNPGDYIRGPARSKKNEVHAVLLLSKPKPSQKRRKVTQTVRSRVYVFASPRRMVVRASGARKPSQLPPTTLVVRSISLFMASIRVSHTRPCLPRRFFCCCCDESVLHTAPGLGGTRRQSRALRVLGALRYPYGDFVRSMA